MFTDRLRLQLDNAVAYSGSESVGIANIEEWKRVLVESRKGEEILSSKFLCEASRSNDDPILEGVVVIPGDLCMKPHFETPLNKCDMDVVESLGLRGNSRVSCVSILRGSDCPILRVSLRDFVFPVVCARERTSMSSISGVERARIFAGLLLQESGLKLSPIPVASKVSPRA